MSFTSKKLQSKKNSFSFLKGATLFFLGMSCIIVVTNAFDITPSTINAVQYIQSIFLTASGNNTSATGIYLDGTSGDAYFAGNVGIGKTNPTNNLEVNGTGAFSGNIVFMGHSDSTIQMLGSTAHTLNILGQDGGLGIGGDMQIEGGGGLGGYGDIIMALNGGNVGIGSSPLSTHKLDVNGNARIMDYVYLGGGHYNPLPNLSNQGGVLTIKGATVSTFGSVAGKNVRINGGDPTGLNTVGNVVIADDGGKVGIGNAIPSYKLDVDGTGSFDGICLSGDCRSTWPTGGTAGGESIWSTGAGGRAYYNSGYVGIGNAIPSYKLDVAGDISATGSIAIRSDACGSIPDYEMYSCGTKIGIIGSYGYGLSDTFSVLGKEGGSLGSFSGAIQQHALVWTTGGYVGIGTPTPTEQLQIGNYGWIGRDGTAGSSTGGAFLRLYGSRVSLGRPPGPKTTPNIQLNYSDYASNPSDIDNRQIDGGSVLSFNHSDASNIYKAYMSISSLGHISINGATASQILNLSGNMRLQNSSYISAGLTNPYQIFLDSVNGYVGINEPSPGHQLDVNGDVEADVYYYSSDKRLKTDINTITDPLQKILSLNGYNFTWKKTGKKDMGVIAQEVEKIFPNIVNTSAEGYKSVEYGNLVAPLIEAIKELNSKVDAQAKEIATLKNKIQ